eukprot:98014_1
METAATMSTIVSLAAISHIMQIVGGIPANTRYVVDNATQTGETYALPIDLCFKSHGILEAVKWSRYECNGDGSEVYRKVWDTTNPENDCQTNTGGQITATFTTNAATCGIGTFECNGLNSYALINTYANDATCEVPGISIPIVPGCFCSTMTASFQTSCTDASTGTFDAYNDTATCDTVPVISQNLGVCSVVSHVIGIGIQSKMTECVLNVVEFTPLPTTQPTTAHPTDQPTPRPSFAPNTLTFNPKYIMDNATETAITYPLAIDICFKSHGTPFTAARWTRYQCGTDGSFVYRKIWDDTTSSAPQSDCERNVHGTVTATFTESTTSCGVGTFECDGDNSYALTSVYLNDATCTSSQTIDLPIALGCFCDTDTTSIETWCDGDASGGLTTHNTTSMCDSNGINTYDLSTCSVLYDEERFGIPIQFKMTKCAANTTLAPTQTAMPTTAPTTREPTEQPTSRPSIPPNTMTSAVNYVMDNDVEPATPYPLPIDVCFQSYGIAGSFSPQQWSRYECNAQGTQVSRRIWNETISTTPDSDCQSNTGGVITATFAGNTGTSCGVGAFECNGVNNYVMSNFYFSDATCAGPGVLFPIVIGCFCDTDSTSIQAWCSDEQTGVVNTYNSTTMCDNHPIAARDLGVCSVFTTVLGSINIQVKISECVLNGVSHTPLPTIPISTYEPSSSPTKRPSSAPSKGPSESPSKSPFTESTIIEQETTEVDIRIFDRSSTLSVHIVFIFVVIIVNLVEY